MTASSSRILSVDLDIPLLQTRSLLLTRSGYTVASCETMRKARALLASSTFDLLIMGQTLSIKDRNALAVLFKSAQPTASILALVRFSGDDALSDVCFDTYEGPEQFLNVVTSLIKKPVKAADAPVQDKTKSKFA